MISITTILIDFLQENTEVDYKNGNETNEKTWRFFIGLFAAIIMIGLGIAMIVAGESVITAMQQGIGIFLIIHDACSPANTII